MHVAYLDEAGIGSVDHEPVVVAGVIIHAAAQWKTAERRLKEIADKYILDADRKDFVAFHAKDIWHESPKFPRDRYNGETRENILQELCSLIGDLDLTVVFGALEKKDLSDSEPYKNLNRHDLAIMLQAMASTMCTLAIETYMRTHHAVDELVMIVYENNDNAKALVRALHNLLRGPQDPLAGSIQEAAEWAQVTPLKRVIDTAHFANKEDASILQLADLCAFILRRRIMGKTDCERFFEMIRPHCVVAPKDGWKPISSA
jgi:hypothetical protein